MIKYKKWINLIYAILLVLSMVLPLIAYPVQSESGAEVINLRTETSRTYNMGNGKYRAELYSGIIHYKDNYNSSLEQWKDIDLTMVNGKVTKAPYELTINGLDVSIKNKKTGAEVILRLTDVGTSKVSTPTLVISGNKATATNIATDTDLEISWGLSSVKYTRILKSASAPLAAKFDITQTGTGLVVTTEATDSKTLTNKSVPVISSIKDGVLTESIDSKVALTYPVRIDPTTTVYNTSASDGTMIGDIAAQAYSVIHDESGYNNSSRTSELMWIGQDYDGANYFIDRSLYFFDTSGIPDTDTITAATLSLYGAYDQSDADFDLTIVNGVVAGQDHFPHDPFVSGDYLYTQYSSGGGTFGTAGWSLVGFNVINLSETGLGWINKTGTTKLGVFSSEDIADSPPTATNEVVIPYAYEKGVGYIPHLEVTYEVTSTAPTVTTQSASSVESTTATYNGNVTSIGTANVTLRGFAWGTTSNTTDPVAAVPPTASYSSNNTASGNWGTGTFTYAASSLTAGTTYYYRAYAYNGVAYDWGDQVSFLLKPAAPTSVAATDGTSTTKVVVTWTKSTGATGYKVYEGVNLLDTLGDVATYDDNAAPAPTITSGNATASDGTSTVHVVCGVINEVGNNGASRTYKVVALNASGDSDDSATNAGYRGITTLTYVWYRSAADSNANYTASGGVTENYNDAGAPLGDAGRYFLATVSMTGATSANTTADRGYRALLTSPDVTTIATSNVEETTATGSGNITSLGSGGEDCTIEGIDYDINSGAPYTFNAHNDGSYGLGVYTVNLVGLSEGTLYYNRAYATNPGGTGEGAEVTFLTKPNEPTAFTATAGDEHVDLAWTKGTGAQKTMIRYRTDGVYPTDPANGTQAYFDVGVAYAHNGLVNGTEYKYRMWSYVTDGGLTQYSDTYDEDTATPIGAPEVTTTDATLVEEVTATGNGDILDLNGGGNASVHGVEWDINSGAPYLGGDAHTHGVFGLVSFSDTITGLSEGTLYYYRTYATNPVGTAYSANEKTFLTKPLPPTAFTATGTVANDIDLVWVKGTGADLTYIRGKLGSAPVDITDGTYLWNGAGTTVTMVSGNPNEHWYFLAWSSTTDGGITKISDAPDASSDAWTSLQVGGDTTCTGRGRDWATIKADLTGAGAITRVDFQYGLTDAYGSVVSRIGGWVNGDSVIGVIRGLHTASSYHYRIRVYQGALSGYSVDDTFATLGSPSLFEFLNAGDDTDSIRTASGNITYQTFTTEDTSHTVTSVRLKLKRVGAPGSITVSLRNANAAATEPTGVDLCSVILSSTTMSTAYTWYSFTFVATDVVSLAANIPYAIVITAPSGDATNYVMWALDSGDGEADGRYGYSLDGGITFTSVAGSDELFEVWGYPALQVLNAKVFTGYAATDDWLLVVEEENNYPPYYTEKDDPSAWFLLQLVDSNTNQVKAATPIIQWQRQPLGIYISPTDASVLTWSGNYIARMTLIDGSDYQEYPLQLSDWRGDDMTYLDQWVRSTASDLQIYYGIDLLTSDPTKGGKLILNSAGGVMFARGIPALTNIRPDLFADVGDALTPHTETTFTKNVQLGRPTAQTTLGTNLYGIIQDGATLAGVAPADINTFISIIWIIAYIILVMFIGFGAVGGFLPVVLAIPFVLVGGWIGMIDMSYIAALLFLAGGITLFNKFVGYSG
jgi:hypothetical protein